MSHVALDLVPKASEDTRLVQVVSDTAQEDAAHYRTSGFAVLGMGGLAFGLYGLTVNGIVTEGFIDANGVLAIACIFSSVGAYMIDVLSLGDG